MQICSPQLNRTATLPCETWMIEIATDLDENAYIKNVKMPHNFGNWCYFIQYYLIWLTGEKIFTVI